MIVLMHRPLWRQTQKENPANWDSVHSLLNNFNHRPIVTVEGFGTAGTEARGPRVVVVFAGSERAYSRRRLRAMTFAMWCSARLPRRRMPASPQTRRCGTLRGSSSTATFICR